MDKIVLLEGNAPKIYKEYMNASLLMILLCDFSLAKT